MSQADDMDAINVYMGNQKPQTKKAAEVRDEWIRWWEDLSWMEKALDGPTYDKARNLRTEYNRANAVTPKEKASVEKTVKTGLTTEVLEGGTSRQLESGEYDVPLLSTKQQAYLGTALGVVVAGAAAVGAGILFVKSQPALKALAGSLDAFKGIKGSFKL